MGETIDQTRVEIAAQRAELEATATGLRDALDLPRRLRDNPAQVIGIGAVAAFLIGGGPRRVARILRRRMAPNTAEKAYEALPSTMQAWVDTLAGEAGPRGAAVRDDLVEQLRRWRRDPVKDRKARRELARQMVEGPAGPARTAWTVAETALTLVAAALARKAIERFLTNERRRPGSAAGTAAGSSTGGDVAGPSSAPGYAGWSRREESNSE